MRSFLQKFSLFVFLLLPASLFALFIGPTLVPVDRLIANTKAFLKDNPKNHAAYYTLARIHYLAFVNKSNFVGAMSKNGSEKHPQEIAPDWLLGDYIEDARYIEAERLALKELGIKSLEKQSKEIKEKYYALYQKKKEELKNQKWEPEKIKQEDLFNHVKEAIINFNKSIEIDPKNGLYHLGLASLYSQYLSYKKSEKIQNEPKELKEITLDKAQVLFFKAYSLTVENDLLLKNQPTSGLKSVVSFEAGNAYVKNSKLIENITEDTKKNIEKISENLEKLKKLPNGFITPIIFTLEKHANFSELLAPNLKVNFDLDGDGNKEMWPWLSKTTGLLVWDPQNKGIITSGRQLFGSVTWWIFFETGYQALDALDNNRDGQLSNDELNGIAAWYDKNSNGISDPGEVVDLKSLGIQSIATKQTGAINGMPMNSFGIILDNGKSVPTYDWVAARANH